MTSVWPQFHQNYLRSGQSIFTGGNQYQKWNYTDSAVSIYSSPVFDSNNNVYVVTSDEAITILSPTGSLKQKIFSSIYGFCTTCSLAITASNDILAMAFSTYYNTSLVSLSPTGSILWAHSNFTKKDLAVSSPACGFDGTIYYATTYHVVSLTSAGIYKWSFNVAKYSSTDYIIQSSVSSDGSGNSYIGTNNGFLHSFAPTGSRRWTAMLSGSIYAAPALGPNGMIYAASQISSSGTLYSIFPNSTFFWTIKVGPIWSTPAVGVDPLTIYFGESFIGPSKFYAATEFGTIRWSTSLSNSITSSPAIGSDGTVYIHCDNSYLYSYTSSGHKNWQYLTNTNFYISATSSPAIANGTVIVGSSSGNVFAVGNSEVTFASTVSMAPVSGPTGVTPASNPDAGTANTTVIIIAVVVVCGFFIIAGPLLVYMYCSRLKSMEISLQSGSRTLDFAVIHSKSTDNSMPIPRRKHDTVTSISWNDIRLSADASPKEAVLGHGSFGTVVRALWFPGGVGRSGSPIEVAVKVLTRSQKSAVEKVNFEKMLDKAFEEVEFVVTANKKLRNPECIILAHGVAEGPLPDVLTSLFHIQPGEYGVGVVMRFEKGGSLETVLHKRRPDAPQLTLLVKVRLLAGIAQGLAEIHAVGIVHGDIKPDNILLSDSDFSQVRLADFGLSTIREVGERDRMGQSSLLQTKHLKGTPIYCAPEMLVNPYKLGDEVDETVAKASAKTDMYAFAILAWQTLTQEKPFSDIKSEGTLCAKVHQDIRPPLTSLSDNTPNNIIDMITCCWDKDRANRKTALECYTLLQQEYSAMEYSTVFSSQTE